MGGKYRQEIIATIFAFFRTGGMYILTNIVIFLWIVFGFWMSPGGKTAVCQRALPAKLQFESQYIIGGT
jgi:hypothetical protein